MLKIIRFSFFLACIVLNFALVGQTYTISGKVFDAESKEPLPFVPVLIKGTTVGATTDFDGNFSITTAKFGDSLVSTYVGYKKLARALKRGENQIVTMPMVLEGVNLLEVVVKAGENPAHRIIRNVIANKPINNKRELEAYQYETYNKVEFDLNRIPKENFLNPSNLYLIM